MFELPGKAFKKTPGGYIENFPYMPVYAPYRQLIYVI